MNNNELEDNLLKLFSSFKSETGENSLVEEIKDNCLSIRETGKGGENEVYFTSGRFIRLSGKVLGDKFTPFFNHPVIRKICDGIFLVQLKDRIILCLVELKSNINNNFTKAIQQIEGSYIKAALLLSLLYNIKDIEMAVFIGGRLEKIKDEPDIDYLEKVDEFSNITGNAESKLKEFSLESKVRMDFPFFLEESIHEKFRKKNTTVYHLGCGGVFDMQTL